MSANTVIHYAWQGRSTPRTTVRTVSYAGTPGTSSSAPAARSAHVPQPEAHNGILGNRGARIVRATSKLLARSARGLNFTTPYQRVAGGRAAPQPLGIELVHIPFRHHAVFAQARPFRLGQLRSGDQQRGKDKAQQASGIERNAPVAVLVLAPARDSLQQRRSSATPSKLVE